MTQRQGNASQGERPIRLVIAVTEVGDEAAAGDYFTALELGTALAARFGWEVAYRPHGAGWYDMAGVDVVVAMVDDYSLPDIRHAPPGLVTVAWARNWFDRWANCPWIADYDLLLASSRRAVDFLSRRTGKLARLLRIAANVNRFHPGLRADAPQLDYVFTGSYWQADRDVVAAFAALPRTLRGAIYGKHWDAVPELSHLARGFVPYRDIHQIYQQSVIVVDDANHVTKDWGAANSRVFDALAAGCLVITNSRPVSDEVFDGRLPVYHNPQALATLLDRYLSNADERIALARDLRQTVLARHGYQHRALEFVWHLQGARLGGANVQAATTTRWHAKPAAPLAAEVRGVDHPRCGPAAGQPLRGHSVSVVVPVFNHLAHTQAMLRSLQDSLPEGLDCEIILVDDASTDGTRDWLAGLRSERLKVHLNASNQGFAATCNAGAQLAKGDLLCFLNNDLILAPGWLGPMLQVLLDPRCKAGVVGNVQRRVDDGALDHAGVRLNAAGQLEHIRHLDKTDLGQGAGAAEALAVTGACVVVRRSDFEACGGFEAQYRNGGEDMDLCFKLRARGLRAYVALGSCVAHHVSLSRGPASLNDERNSRLLYRRWRSLLKQELTNVWLGLLASGGPYPEKPENLVDGALLATPHLACRRIAEAMLLLQEVRWADLMGPLDDEHGA